MRHHLFSPNFDQILIYRFTRTSFYSQFFPLPSHLKTLAFYSNSYLSVKYSNLIFEKNPLKYRLRLATIRTGKLDKLDLDV